jgi:hypothetical protein
MRLETPSWRSLASRPSEFVYRREHGDASRIYAVETGLPGWACKTRTGESVCELSNWNYVTTGLGRRKPGGGDPSRASCVIRICSSGQDISGCANTIGTARVARCRASGTPAPTSTSGASAASSAAYRRVRSESPRPAQVDAKTSADAPAGLLHPLLKRHDIALRFRLLGRGIYKNADVPRLLLRA